jgi:pyruvate dehydrogenase (quinone)
MASTVAEILVATLKASGVRRVYGIPGDSVNGFTDALRRDGGIAWQHVRHEEAAAFAAAGEAALTGELHLPVKVVVFNNGALSFVELEMKAAGIVTYGTDLDNPDFAGIARATGLFGARVEQAGELDDALRAAFGHDGPALVDVRTDRYELSLPPKLTLGEIKGFTLYATRTILSGEGTELVELAESNLRDLEVE